MVDSRVFARSKVYKILPKSKFLCVKIVGRLKSSEGSNIVNSSHLIAFIEDYGKINKISRRLPRYREREFQIRDGRAVVGKKCERIYTVLHKRFT